MEKTIETRVIDTLKPHPRNQELYGDESEVFDQAFADLLKDGIWPAAIQITKSGVIISGHRRCYHATWAGIETADVWVRTDLPDDPNSPEVLRELLQANNEKLQRQKTNEQKLREFELWLEVEKDLAKKRRGANQYTAQGPGKISKNQVPRISRDEAAKRTDLGSGKGAQEALNALRAAEKAAATGNPEQLEKARLVKQELARSLGGAVRVAREQGLIAAPKPKPKKVEAQPPEEPELEPAQALETQPPAPEPEETTPSTPEPELVLEPVIAKAKLKPISPENRKLQASQGKWIMQRWLPAAQQLVEAVKILRAEGDRLGQAWRHKENGGQLFTIPYQRLAAEWQEKGYLAELAEALGCKDQSLDAVLLQFQHMAEVCASMADGIRMYTGCRQDNNFHH